MTKILDKFQTDRLILRGIDETDALEIVEWRSYPDVYKYFKSPHMITVSEHVAWYINSYLKKEERLDWMCIEKASGRKIGVFGLYLEGNTAEINYLLAKDAQHKGYAMEAIQCLLRYAFERKKVKSVRAEIHRENVPSIRLIQKAGFSLQSSKGDFIVYERTGVE